MVLLYVTFFHLCVRQLDYGGAEEAVTRHVLEFVDILTPHALGKTGSWDLLGALGLSSSYKMSPRARFLAVSLVVYLRSQVVDGNKRMRYRRRKKSAGEEEEEGADPDAALPPISATSVELVASREVLLGLRTQRAFLGLSDLIDWVADFSADEANELGAVDELIRHLVPNRLYVEKYLQLWSEP